jgi:hypothetical protein
MSSSVHEQISHANCFLSPVDLLPPDLKFLPILMQQLELYPVNFSLAEPSS